MYHATFQQGRRPAQLSPQYLSMLTRLGSDVADIDLSPPAATTQHCTTAVARFARSGTCALTLELRWHRFEFHRAIISQTKHLVEHRAVLYELTCRFPNQLDLLVTKQASALDQYDAGVNIARPCELLEIANVRGDQNTVLLKRSFKQFLICRPENPAIAHMIRVDAFSSQRYRCGRGQVLIEEKLDGHADAQREDTRSRTASRTRRLVLRAQDSPR